MKKTTILLFFGLVLLFDFKIYAQEERTHCGTDKVIKELYKTHPESQIKAQQFNLFTKEFAKFKNTTQRDETSYIIPVVFHVFGTDFLGATVDDAVITEALRQVNIDFHGLNTDFDDVIDHFKPLRATMDVTFQLASIDPDGNASTGINYYEEKSGFGNGGGYNDQIQRYAWDNNKYMNVYIMLDLYDDGETNRSGVAWYPDQWMTDNNLARVVYNGRYLWGNHLDNEFQATLTHEFGHYLNLPHTFDNGCDGEGDLVDDTPATTTNYECEATETCEGAGIANTSNYMDYSSCRRMFTIGQVARMDAAMQHGTRFPLWQDTNLQATGVGAYVIDAHVISSSKWFQESVGNDGAIQNTLTITAKKGAQFTLSTGELTEGTHFNVTNLPEGLSAQFTATTDTTLVVTLTGNATAHENDIDNITFSFLDDAIVGGVSAIFSPNISGVSIDFIAPYKMVYNDIDDATANASATWSAFTIPDVGDGSFGAWYSGGLLRFETYTKSLICEGTTRNISLLNFGDMISAESNWVEGGAYPDEHDIRNDGYTDWDGKEGYIGFQVTNQRGETIYGWFGAEVSENGDSFSITEYAYNEDPNGSILAGYSGLGARLVYSSNTFFESGNNDGTIETTISVNGREGAEFEVTSGALTENTHFTVANLPDGLALNITATSAVNVEISISGTATSNEDANDVNNLEIEFLDAAFTGNASEIGNTTKSDFIIDFVSDYKIIYSDIDDITVDKDFTWQWFSLNSGADDDAYGVWFDSGNGNLRFETYSKSMVSEGSTRNISLLNEGDMIDDASNWVAGGAYPDEHDVRNTDYTVWDGKTGYMGFQFVNANGKVNYGWFKLSVSADGGSMTLYEWAYYEKPKGSIAAGFTGEIAAFEADDTHIGEGESVSFTDQSFGTPTSWSWTFEGGDPATSTDQNPTVTYTTAGIYDVTLVINGELGIDTIKIEDYITVEPMPVANFEGNETAVEEGSSISFSDMSTGDPVSWTWTFEGGNPATSSNQNPTVFYHTAGTYSVSLTVTNSVGSNTKTVTSYVTISEITGLSRNKLNAEVKLFPNPNNGLFNLAINAEKESIRALRVFNLKGKEVYSQVLKSNTQKFTGEIDLNNQAKGVYILMIVGENHIGTRKVVIK